MGTVASFLNAPIPPVQLSVAVPVATPDIVSTRLTTNAAPAPLSTVLVGDNAQGSGVAIAAPASAVIATVTASAAGDSGLLAGNISASGSSSTFLAQLYSQNDNQSNIALADNATFAPATQYNTLANYSYIKYKPSDAGVPAPPSPLPAPVDTQFSLPVAPVVSVPQPTAAVQADNTVTPPPEVVVQTVTTPATSVSDNNVPVAPATVSPSSADVTPVATAPANTQPANTAQLISDYQAYSDTASRNQSNLNSSIPQVVVAG